MAILLQADVDINDPTITEYFKGKTDLSWVRTFPNTRIKNTNAVWESDPQAEYQLDTDKQFKKSRPAGNFSNVPGEPADNDEDNTLSDQSLQLNTCARATYRVYKDSASYTIRTVDIPLQHKFKCSIYSDLFVSDKADESQESEIIQQFDLADANSPAIGSIVSKLESLGIDSSLYDVVPRIKLIREDLIAHTSGLERFLSLQERGQAAEYWQGSWIIDEDGRRQTRIDEWVDGAGIKIKFASVEHLSTILPVPELREHTYEQPITDAKRHQMAVDEVLQDDLRCDEFSVKEDNKFATILGYPEFRIKWKKKRIKVGCVKITVTYPQLQTRWTTEDLFFMIVAETSIDRLVISVGRQCGIKAFLVGGITAYLSGNFPLAVKAFKAAFYVCIVEKLTDFPTCFIPELKIVTNRRKWHPL